MQSSQRRFFGRQKLRGTAHIMRFARRAGALSNAPEKHFAASVRLPTSRRWTQTNRFPESIRTEGRSYDH